MNRLREVDTADLRRRGFNTFTKMIRTKVPNDALEDTAPAQPGARPKLSRCLTTLDLTSLGVGSCVGTGMYLVTGMVAKSVAGPGVIFSFAIAALASIFSGACYAEFGVRVPHTSGSAYSYSYVAVGEFIAFVIGWNMVLEYLIGTSACACALSASFDALTDGAITAKMAKTFGTIFGRPPDLVAFVLCTFMMVLLAAGVRKSLIFNNILNGINLCIWVFMMTAGLFYVKTSNWTDHGGFLPFGWSGVFSGAATCFYAFIGFDIIATTGEEAHNPKRSIPLAILASLSIILTAYVTSSMMLTLIVPYDEVRKDSALVEMFAQVGAHTCKYIVSIGAIAGLTVSMFGSMFPMPRIMYAMAKDGLIFKQISAVWPTTGTPAVATFGGGMAAALVALLVQLEVLVEMMSIGTLLAYTLVSTCVLVLRYQPNSTNLIELLPQSLRTPIPETPKQKTTSNAEISSARSVHFGTYGELGVPGMASTTQHVTIRRVTRSSPDSDESFPGDDLDEFGRDNQYLVTENSANEFYGSVHTSTQNNSKGFIEVYWTKFTNFIQEYSYLCPGLFPWIDPGPPTEISGMFVIKSIGVMYSMILLLDIIAAYGSPGTSTFTVILMTGLVLGIIFLLFLISRKPQNRSSLLYMTPGLPFVPAIAVTVNIYLILNLSVLTLIRFTVWMTLGMVMYFKYGINNSTLNEPAVEAQINEPESAAADLMSNIKVVRPQAAPEPLPSKNIFEGDFYESGYDPFNAWDQGSSMPQSAYAQVEQRFDQKTNRSTAHATTSQSVRTNPFPSWNN